MQLSGFARYSQLNYQPDAIGDLLYNGFAPWAQRTSFATGVQGDASWKVGAQAHAARRLPHPARARHELRPGQRPAAGSRPGRSGCARHSRRQPVGLTDGSDLTGWTYSVYLQDEWKVLPTLTVNAGLRFDAITGTISENQLSPRVNVVWEPTPEITLRAGYARYFVPAPLNQVSVAALAARAGTTAAPEVMTNDPVRAERSDNIDIGLTVKPVDGLTIGFSGFYKWAENYLDKGQFGAPIFQTAFNYSNAQVRGFELFANYDKGPVVALRQPRLVAGQLDQHHLGPVQLRAGGPGLHRQQLDLRRPQPELDGLGRCRLRVQHGQRTGRPGSRPTSSTATACARRS